MEFIQIYKRVNNDEFDWLECTDLIFLSWQRLIQEREHLRRYLHWTYWVWELWFDWLDYPLLSTVGIGELSFCQANSLCLSSLIISISWIDLPQLTTFTVLKESFHHTSTVSLIGLICLIKFIWSSSINIHWYKRRFVRENEFADTEKYYSYNAFELIFLDWQLFLQAVILSPQSIHSQLRVIYCS